MGISQLREIYGPKSKGPAVVGRAVRAEIPGAEQLYALKNELLELKRDRPELEPLYRRALAAIAEMRDAIAVKYELASKERPGEKTE